MKYLITPQIILLSFCLSSLSHHSYSDDLLEEMIVVGQADSGIPIRWNHEDIKQAGIEKTSDIANLVPNFSMDNAGANNTIITVRGISHLNDKTNSPVAINIDNLQLSDQNQLKQPLYNIEHIEVIKGPQVLSAQNAPGGAIHIVTRKPSNKHQSYLKVGGGSDGMESLGASYGGPAIKDKLFFSFTGLHQRQDGQITNSFLDKKVDFSESDSFYAHLLWQATKMLTTNLKLAYTDANHGAQYYSSIPDGEGANTFLPPSSNQLGENQQEDINVSFKSEWESPLGHFSAITAYTDLDKFHLVDADFDHIAETQAVQRETLDLELISQEFRLTSANNSPLQWTIGTYLQESNKRVKSAITEQVTITKDDNQNVSGFGQIEYMFKNHYEIALGLRYDRNERNAIFNNGTDNLVRKETFSDWQPKITLSKEWKGGNSAYVTYSSSFRPGGFNFDRSEQLFDRDILNNFDSESLDSYEFGTKSQWLDNRFIFNAAVFYAQSRNYQVFERELEENTTLITGEIFIPILVEDARPIVSNIDKVDIWGMELDIKIRPAKNWLINLSAGITDTEIKAYPDSPLTPFDEQSFVGNQTPRNTKYTVNFSSQYTMRINARIKSLFRLDYEHYGPKYWTAANSHSMNSYGLLNARISSYYGKKISLSFWGKNLTDEKYWTDFIVAEFSASNLETVDLNAGVLGHQRALGIDLKYQI